VLATSQNWKKKKHRADFSKVNVGLFCEFFFNMMMFKLRVKPNKGGDITKIRGVDEVIVKFTLHFGNVNLHSYGLYQHVKHDAKVIMNLNICRS
jgi:hypothetical protein